MRRFFDFRGQHALTAQGGLDLVFTDGACFPTDYLAVAVFAFPLEDEVFDVSFRYCGRHAASSYV